MKILIFIAVIILPILAQASTSLKIQFSTKNVVTEKQVRVEFLGKNQFIMNGCDDENCLAFKHWRNPPVYNPANKAVSFGNPAHKLCFQLEGIPQSITVNDGKTKYPHQWCQFKDGSFITLNALGFR